MSRMLNSLYAFARKTLLILPALFVVAPGAIAETSFDLERYRGKVVVLDFWASWCVPCRRSFPWMNEMQEKYAEQGLMIVAVNMDAEPELAQAFLQEYPAHFELIEDREGELARKFDVIAMPSSYVIDRNGEIVKRHLGFKVKRQDEYEALIKEVLAGT